MMKEVAVTGMGAVCCGGNDKKSLSETVLKGVSSLSLIEDPKLTHFNGTHAGFTKKFTGVETFAEFPLREYDRYIQLAACAAKEALADADICPSQFGNRIGLFFATCSGPMQTIEHYYQLTEEEKQELKSEENFKRKYYSATKVLCHIFSISGIATTITTACSASSGALGIAYDLIEQGVLSAALVGGADSFSATTFAGFEGLKATCASKCAPFSKPIGMNLGEGSGFLLLEEMEHAKKRKIHIYTKMLGYGMSNDAYHSSAPDLSGRGQAFAMERAIKKTGIESDKIPYVNAHGTGTYANDKSETKAMRRVFVDNIDSLCVSSSKSMVGHCLGAAGALEMIISIISMENNVYPPTANFTEARDGCSLDYIPDSGRAWIGNKTFMSNNFAFGGNNVSVIMSSDRALEKTPTVNQTDEPICITSCGIVSPAGIGIESLAKFFDRGMDCFSKEKINCDEGIKCARVASFNERNISRRLDLRGMDNASRYAAVAAKLAMQGAGLPERLDKNFRLGFYLSVFSGSTRAEAEHITSLYENNFSINQVQSFPYIVPNSIGGNVCRTLGLNGHNTVFSAGQNAGVMALALGVNAIRGNHVDAILCGATDELLDADLKEYINEKKSNDCNNYILGEGSALYMIESISNAQKRGVKPIGYICGMSFSSETEFSWKNDLTADSMHKNIINALEIAEITYEDIGVICCMKNDKRIMQTLKNIGIYEDKTFLDVSDIIGNAQTTLPLMTMAYALNNSQFGNVRNRKYILSVFTSQIGFNSAVILKKE